jgi:hypothetical protein
MGVAGSTMSRREWLRHAPLPVIGAAIGTGMIPVQAGAQGPTHGGEMAPGARTYDVTAFGAKGDKVMLCTSAVQAAIDACHKDGGGTAVVPAGVFRIGTVELRSNVTLYLCAGATLLGSASGKDYHAVDAIPLTGDHTLNDGNWALIFAVGAKNVTVAGPGTIDGQGTQFHSPVRGTPAPSGLSGNDRPYHLLFHKCENLTVREISLVDCAYHSVRVIQSRHVHMDQLYIHNRVNSNNDGFHFISAEYVTVSNCIVLAQDDACAMFGSCKFFTITNSTFSTRWSVFRFGGGNPENITVSNCLLYEVYGCPIKFHGSPGSTYKNMSFSNLVMRDVTGPIHISLGPDGKRAKGADGRMTMMDPPVPQDAVAGVAPAEMRNISFNNIHGTVTTNPPQLAESTYTSRYNIGEQHSAIVVSGVGGSVIENISFNNVHLTFGGGGTAEEAARRELPGISGEYFMLGPMPAYGFFARNVKGLTLTDIRLQVSSADLRPALILQRVDDVAINGLSVQADKGVESALRFVDCRDVLVTAPRLLNDTATFLQVEGKRNERITVDGGDVSRARTAVAYERGAVAGVVKHRA